MRLTYTGFPQIFPDFGPYELRSGNVIDVDDEQAASFAQRPDFEETPDAELSPRPDEKVAKGSTVVRLQVPLPPEPLQAVGIITQEDEPAEPELEVVAEEPEEQEEPAEPDAASAGGTDEPAAVTAA